MKIAFVLHDTFGKLGSASSYYFPEILSLTEEVLVICPEPTPESKKLIIREACNAPVRYLRGSRVRRLWKTAKILNDFHPDIVHFVYNPRIFPDVVFCRLLAEKSARLVLDIRAPLLATGAKRILARAMGGVCQFFFSLVFTHADASLRAAIPLLRRPGVLLPPGVDMCLYKPHARTNAPPFTRHVYIGSLARSRNLDIMLKGFQLYAEQQAAPVWLDIYGDGDDRDRLERLYGNARIRFHGRVSQGDIPGRLALYDVGMAYVPGGKYDGAPSLKMLEYAAAGLQILASNTAGHMRYTSDGFSMIFFENTSESVAQALHEVSTKGVSASSLQKNIDIVSRYDWRQLVGNIVLPQYRSLLHGALSE